MPELSELYNRVRAAGRLSVDFARYGRPGVMPPPAGDEAVVLDRMRGALLGGAIGDALGGTLEFAGYPHPRWVEHYHPGEDPDGPGFRRPPGAITDDTQLTMWLAESLLERGGLDPEDVVRWFTASPIRGIGIATSQFVANCRQGLPWDRCGVRSAGNGVAMRSAPVGLFYGRDFGSLKLAAGLQALITHNDPMAIASGIMVAYAVARLVAEPSGALDPLEARIAFCRDLAAVIEGMETGGAGMESERAASERPAMERRKSRRAASSRAVSARSEEKDGEVVGGYRNRQGMPDSLYRRVGTRIPELLAAGATAGEVQEEFGSSAYVLESLPFAIFCFLQSPHDFRRTLLDAVNLGEDSDTTGAMACTLSGAYNGASAIPAEYLEGLEYRFWLEGLAAGFAERWRHADV